MTCSLTSIRLFVLVSFFGAMAATAQPELPGRFADPVVLTGDELPRLVGSTPSALVAFRYLDSGWVQIPVQVDERFVADYEQIYNGTSDHGQGFSALVYADPGTYTGADPDATFDADDELVFMARDAGAVAPSGTAPGGVVAKSGLKLQIVDPVSSEEGTVYLFERAGALDPAAGQDYVDYTFDLVAGAYFSAYSLNRGPNPEDSRIESDYYTRHFSDRWVSDGLTIAAGSGADLLDRHQAFFAPGVCSRTEDTFSGGEGAFITNIDGPVRAIRAYLGANSGPITERRHMFYEQREEIVTSLRVHPIAGIFDVFDYEPGVAGMTYTNDLLATSLVIDGQPEDATVAGALLGWELVAGDPGSLVISHALDTDAPASAIAAGTYWEDNTQTRDDCTGDEQAYGKSGPAVFFTQEVCTDPLVSGFNCDTPYRFVAQRTITYRPPGVTAAEAALLHRRTAEPIQVRVEPLGTVSAEDPTDSAGRGVSLWGPYPNPARSGSAVIVELEEAGPVRLAVYDALGREVAVLADETLGAGHHHYRTGQLGLRSGFFVLRLVSERGVQVRRLVVTR